MAALNRGENGQDILLAALDRQQGGTILEQ
jgi:hypothetical protein